jgi:hypothetical protein
MVASLQQTVANLVRRVNSSALTRGLGSRPANARTVGARTLAKRQTFAVCSYVSCGPRARPPWPCPHDSVHDGFFRLWRSVQFADAWAGVDKTGWRSAGRAELMEAAEALAHGPRLPMMLGRDGTEGTPASVLLARAKAAAPVPMSAPVGASYVAAQAAHPAMQAASWGIASSATAPTDMECLASAEARLASLEAEVQRLAMFVAALAHELHDVVRRVG